MTSFKLKVNVVGHSFKRGKIVKVPGTLLFEEGIFICFLFLGYVYLMKPNRKT